MLGKRHKRVFSAFSALALILSLSSASLLGTTAAHAANGSSYSCSDRSSPGSNCYGVVAYNQDTIGAGATIQNGNLASVFGVSGSQLYSNEVWIKDTRSNNGVINCTNYPYCWEEVGYAKTYYCWSGSDCHTDMTFASYVTNRTFYFQYIYGADPGGQAVQYSVVQHNNNPNSQYVDYTAVFPGCTKCELIFYTPLGGGLQPNWTLYGTRLTGNGYEQFPSTLYGGGFSGLNWYPVSTCPTCGASFQTNVGSYGVSSGPLRWDWITFPNATNQGGYFVTTPF
jgi:hypothetical protein